MFSSSSVAFSSKLHFLLTMPRTFLAALKTPSAEGSLLPDSDVMITCDNLRKVSEVSASQYRDFRSTMCFFRIAELKRRCFFFF